MSNHIDNKVQNTKSNLSHSQISKKQNTNLNLTITQSTLKDITGKLLLATPTMVGTPLENKVIFVIGKEHNKHIGVIINSKSDISPSKVFDKIKYQRSAENKQSIKKINLYDGGPVNPSSGLIIHQKSQRNWEHTIYSKDNIEVTVSEDILKAIANGNGPKQHLITFGFYCWDKKQLEQEIKSYKWLVAPNKAGNTSQIILDTDCCDRYEKTANLIGIKNPIHLSSFAGTA